MRAPDAQVSMFVPRGRQRVTAAWDWISLVAKILQDQPALPGALCLGRASMFDGEDAEQTQAALALCAACPVLARCAAHAAAFPVGQLSGVTGGIVYGSADESRRCSRRPVAR